MSEAGSLDKTLSVYQLNNENVNNKQGEENYQGLTEENNYKFFSEKSPKIETESNFHI